MHEGERRGDEACWAWGWIPGVCVPSHTFQLCDVTEGCGLSELPHHPPRGVTQVNEEESAALTQPQWSALSNGWPALCYCSSSRRALFTFQGTRCGDHSNTIWRRKEPQDPSSLTPKPAGSYLGGMVGDALEDPVHGRRVQGEVRRQLHSLDHQLVLHCIPMNLQETKETQIRKQVTCKKQRARNSQTAHTCKHLDGLKRNRKNTVSHITKLRCSGNVPCAKKGRDKNGAGRC